MVNTCIRCGEVIPEGRWFCPICEVEIEELQRDGAALPRKATAKHNTGAQRQSIDKHGKGEDLH